MEFKTYTCEHHATCEIYKNWIEQTNDKRLDVILKLNEKPFSCLVYEALKGAETGIPDGELKGRNIGENCSHILDLNLKLNILNKLGAYFF